MTEPTMRPATASHAPALEALINACVESDVGLLMYRPGGLAAEWEAEDGPKHHLVLEGPDGPPQALLWMEVEDGDEPSLYFEMYIASDDVRIEELLIGAAETKALEMARSLGKPVAVEVSTSGSRSIQLLRSRGYEPGKRDIAMFKDLHEPIEVRWPEGTRLRPFTEGADDDLIYRVMRAGFGDDWNDGAEGQAWVDGHREAPGYAPDLWFFAERDSEVIGAIQCRETWLGTDDAGWVKNLAVLPSERGSGAGRALIEEAFERFRRRGRRRAVLGVHKENPTKARDFYLRIGMYEGGWSLDLTKTVTPAGFEPRS